jgi:hypothetical protein
LAYLIFTDFLFKHYLHLMSASTIDFET